MVRLQHTRSQLQYQRQYQLSIPLWCDCNLKKTKSSQPALAFQSHYGAIATRAPTHRARMRAVLSIPLWCDCNFIQHIPNIHAVLSIPLWCDCNKEEGRSSSRGSAPLSIPLWCDCNRTAKGNLVLKPSAFNPTMVRLQRSVGC